MRPDLRHYMRLRPRILSPRGMFKKSLLARLILLNMLGLLVLLGGFLAFTESRQILTNAYRQNLEAQARLIAGALSQTARPDNPFDRTVAAQSLGAQ